MNPTTYELAAIAAALPSGTPTERVQSALAIWEAADVAAFPQLHRTLQPLGELLAELMPTREPGHRFKRWRDFLTWFELDILLGRQSIANALTKSPEKRLERIRDNSGALPKLADLAADRTMAQHRKKGVPRGSNMAESFRQWDKDKTSQAYSERATKGGKAKAEIAALKAAAEAAAKKRV